MTRALGVLLVGIGCALGIFGCAHRRGADGNISPRFDDRDVLPLVRVRLYASGLGYFERAGRLDADSTALPVPAGHLDDALKSLVLLGSGDDLGSVSFPSRLSPAVARARAGLPTGLDSALSYDRLLVALRGEEVELSLLGLEDRQPSTLRGRVIDVVAVGPTHPSYDHGLSVRRAESGEDEEVSAEEKERLQVLVLSSAGEIVRLDSSQLRSVRAIDPVVAQRLHAALSARLATRSNQYQMLELASRGRRNTEVRLAYLAEAPTWRASYRLLLDEADERQKATRLQAWALVHNDTDEPWRGVELELVDGRPNSFLFPMTAPRYERRELSTPETELSSVPQLSTTTPDALWGDFSEYDGESVVYVGSTGGLGVASGQGFGGGAGRLGGSHKARAPRQRVAKSRVASELLWAGDLARRPGTTRVAETTTSVHPVAGQLDLAPQHSAMVPFLNAPVSATPIVWFEDFDAPARRAVSIGNDTRHTLPAGPLSVFGRGGFLGEAMLESLKPGARQLAEIADEPDAAIVASRPVVSVEAKHVDWSDGRLRVHSFRTSTLRLHFDNRSGRPRTAYVGLDSVLNARVSGADAVDFENASERAFAVFELPLRRSEARELSIIEAISEATESAALTPESVSELSSRESIAVAERDLLRGAMPSLEQLDALRKKERELSLKEALVESRLDRLRKHMDALNDAEGGAAQQQLMERILLHEDELAQVHEAQRQRHKDAERLQQELDSVLQGLERFRAAILQERGAARAAGGA